MNRAAEQAVPAGKEVLVQTVSSSASKTRCS